MGRAQLRATLIDDTQGASIRSLMTMKRGPLLETASQGAVTQGFDAAGRWTSFERRWPVAGRLWRLRRGEPLDVGEPGLGDGAQ